MVSRCRSDRDGTVIRPFCLDFETAHVVGIVLGVVLGVFCLKKMGEFGG